MAKEKKTDGYSKPSKMTVMLFQLEGSDETLQEGFRTINNAIDKLANPVVKVLAPTTSTHLAPGNNGADHNSQLLDLEPQDESESPSEARSETESKPRKPGSSASRQPQILDLDLKAGDTPLKEYLTAKNPTSDLRKYLLIAAWMKANLGLDEINIDHIYTAYRSMRWSSQRDLGGPFRTLKNRNGWFGSGKEKGSYAINHIGIDEADGRGEA